MFAIDTNILLYAHFELYPQHERARSFCEHTLFGTTDWCMGWQVFYEYLRIATHPRVHTQPLSIGHAEADLRPYVSNQRCHMLTQTPQHLQIFQSVSARVPGATGNLLHDCHYATLLHEHNVGRIYTADADFKRFDFLEVIDPTL